MNGIILNVLDLQDLWIRQKTYYSSVNFVIKRKITPSTVNKEKRLMDIYSSIMINQIMISFKISQQKNLS